MFKPLNRRLKLISPGSAQAYAFATICIIAAGLLRWILGLFAHDVLYFPTFYPAVLFAALIGGIGPGVFAACLGGLIGWWIFMTPQYAFFPITAGQQISLLLYFLASLLIVWGADHYRRLAKKLADEETLRKLSVEELAHRLRNKLATIQAIVRFRLREHPQLSKEIVTSLEALSSTDELIMAAQGEGARILDIFSKEIRPYDTSRVSLEGPDFLLPPKLALITALLIHELVTNAVKHGSLSNSNGKVFISWSLVDALLEMEWRENGGPPIVESPSRRGFGMRLFPRALEQFKGNVEVDFAANGLICKVSFIVPTNSSRTIPDTSANKSMILAL